MDGATGSEGPISNWLLLVQRLLMPNYLEKYLKAKSNAKNTPLTYKMKCRNPVKGAKGYVEKFKWSGKDTVVCVGNVELLLNGNIDSRSTRKITFELASGTTYTSGDHLKVHPVNSLDLVHRFAKCFCEELTDAATASRSCPFISNGDDMQASILSWQLQQPFSVNAIGDGGV